MAISRFERGDESVISVATANRAKEWFNNARVFFGPKDSVSLDQDIFTQERWLSSALAQILADEGIQPSSADLIKAANKSKRKTA